MSFRNDQDAAIARIDALERENRQLADENAKLRGGSVTATAPEPPPRPWPYHDYIPGSSRKPSDTPVEILLGVVFAIMAIAAALIAH